MKKLNYTIAKMKVSNLKVHGLLAELGFDHSPTDYLIKALEKDGIYERPIVDKNGYVLSHCAEVLAAQANGVDEIEVCIVERSHIDLTFMVLAKHGHYKNKSLVKSYETAKFLREYLATVDGAEFAQTIPGSMNEKIATIMVTSESTIKRLLRVGDSKPEVLPLIEQGESSLKEELDLMKIERMENNQERKEEKIDSDESEGKEYGVDSEPHVSKPGNGSIESVGKSSGNDVSATPPSSFQENVFSINGFGGLEVSVTDGHASVVVNGKSLKNLVYHSAVARDSLETGRSETFTISQPGTKGISIQLTIENINQAA